MYNKEIITTDGHVAGNGPRPPYHNEIITTDVHVAGNGPRPTFVSAQQQLWRLTNEQYHDYMASTLRYLRLHAQEDLCLALVAYIRYGIRRTFVNQFMARVFADCVCVLDHI